jgi:hypothetical protein
MILIGRGMRAIHVMPERMAGRWPPLGEVFRDFHEDRYA